MTDTEVHYHIQLETVEGHSHHDSSISWTSGSIPKTVQDAT